MKELFGVLDKNKAYCYRCFRLGDIVEFKDCTDDHSNILSYSGGHWLIHQGNHYKFNNQTNPIMRDIKEFFN